MTFLKTISRTVSVLAISFGFSSNSFSSAFPEDSLETLCRAASIVERSTVERADTASPRGPLILKNQEDCVKLLRIPNMGP